MYRKVSFVCVRAKRFLSRVGSLFPEGILIPIEKMSQSEATVLSFRCFVSPFAYHYLCLNPFRNWGLFEGEAFSVSVSILQPRQTHFLRILTISIPPVDPGIRVNSLNFVYEYSGLLYISTERFGPV